LKLYSFFLYESSFVSQHHRAARLGNGNPTAMMDIFRTLLNDGRAHEDCLKNINMKAFASALVKPLYPGWMSSENPKALSLKEDYFNGMSAFYEYIVHGTVPEE
jgi:hypothetical protein